MNKIFISITMAAFLFSCHAHRTSIFGDAYVGMPPGEYQKAFSAEYNLLSSYGKVTGRLQPQFTKGCLTALAFSVNDIDDFETAYTVYELGNDFSEKYGPPQENKETVWAGGSAKYFKWKKGLLDIEYRYKYDQVPGTSGLLYTGTATVVYNTVDNFSH